MNVGGQKNQGAFGVFDSGVGGITVVRQIREYFPESKIFYFGDSYHLPYGDHSLETIKYFAITIMEFLAQLPVRAIFIGCNTSSATLLGTNFEHIQVPVFGLIEPAMSAAARVSESKKVGLIANPPTAGSGVHQMVLDNMNSGVQCVPVPCPKLVPLIEDGKFDSPEMDEAMDEYLRPIRDAGCDVLIHGCTHYPLAQRSIDRIWPDALIIDPAEEMVLLASESLANQRRFREALEEDIYMLSKEWPTFRRTAEMFLGEPIPEPMISNIWDYPPKNGDNLKEEIPTKIKEE